MTNSNITLDLEGKIIRQFWGKIIRQSTEVDMRKIRNNSRLLIVNGGGGFYSLNINNITFFYNDIRAG